MLKAREMYTLLLLINSSITISWKFFVIKYLSNHTNMINIVFFSWIVFINIFLDIMHIIRVINESSNIITCFNPKLSRLLINN